MTRFTELEPDGTAPSRIEDYALIGDTEAAALVARNGSIDWLCLPSFASGACFAALLGDRRHGRWLLRPVDEDARTTRQYRERTLVLETEHHTSTGVVRVVDCMPQRGFAPDVVRVVEGVSGRVEMQMELIVRFDYGSIVPWVRRIDGGVRAIAGPDSLTLRAGVEMRGEGLTTVARFTVSEGQKVPFVLTWHPSHRPPPDAIDARRAVSETTDWWQEWAGRCRYDGGWYPEVMRSLLTLKALTYQRTGGIVAAPTTSLPEQLGGPRNWDYRYCWLRDATFTLYSLMLAGYVDEARGWREWLLRAVAGAPERLQIMYGSAGERRLPELELDWLPGYEGAKPVRVGNAAVTQFQLDVYGEVMDLMHQARRAGAITERPQWSLERGLMDFLESNWSEPDEGIWEVRGRRRQFTHSKVMAWVAVDRAVSAVETFGLDGPVERWRALREEIHAEVCAKGYDADRGTFVQSYGSHLLDASLLMIPLVGFLPADDPRMIGTVDAIGRELSDGGFIARYQHDRDVDGLPEGEGVFLACSFWYADNLALQGRAAEAQELFERLLALRNDVGLLAEEYDTRARRQVGNFPQAFTHVSLVNSAANLSQKVGPAHHRQGHGYTTEWSLSAEAT